MATFFKAIRKTIKHWYIPSVIGLILILVGIYLFTVPDKTYATLVTLFSLSFVLSGLLEVFFSIQNRSELEGWGWYLSSGIFSLVIGILLLARPEVSAITLPLFIGFSLLFRSIQGLGFAFELRNYGALKWGNLAIASILGILFSAILIFNPVFTGLSIAVFISLSFIFTGLSAIVLSFQLKKIKEYPAKISTELQAKIDNLREEYYEYIEDKKDKPGD